MIIESLSNWSKSSLHTRTSKRAHFRPVVPGRPVRPEGSEGEGRPAAENRSS